MNCVFQDGNSNQGPTKGGNSGSHTPGEPTKENSNKVWLGWRKTTEFFLIISVKKYSGSVITWLTAVNWVINQASWTDTTLQ